MIVTEYHQPTNLGQNRTWSAFAANTKRNIGCTGSLVSIRLKQSYCVKTAQRPKLTREEDRRPLVMSEKEFVTHLERNSIMLFIEEAENVRNVFRVSSMGQIPRTYREFGCVSGLSYMLFSTAQTCCLPSSLHDLICACPRSFEHFIYD